MKRICLLTLGLTLTLALTGCGAAPTEQSQAIPPTPSPTPEIILPSEPANTESAPPAPVETAPALPPEPTAAMFRFEGLDGTEDVDHPVCGFPQDRTAPYQCPGHL